MVLHIRLLLALDLIGKNIRKFLGELVMLTLCLFVLSVSVFMKVQGDYCKTSLDLVLTEGVSGTGIVTVGEYDSEAAQLFYQEAEKERELHSIGSLNVGATDILPELAAIQGSHKMYIYGGSDDLECYYMRSDLLDLCNVRLLEGTGFKDISGQDEYWSGLYLGYEYRDIPVGTTYTYNLSNGNVATFEVLGIFDQGSRFVNNKIFFPSMFSTTKLYSDLDYAVVMTDKTMTAYQGLFSFDDYKKAKALLMNLADQYGISIQIASVEEQLKEGARESDSFQELLLRVFLLLAVSVVVCECSFQIVSIWRNSYQYGILVSLGSKMKDIISIVIVGEVIKYVISFLLSAVLSFVFIKYYFTIASDEVSILSELLGHYVLPISFVAGIAISIAGAIVPLIRLSRLSPVEMLKYNPTNIE